MYVSDLVARTPLLGAASWRFIESVLESDVVTAVIARKSQIFVQVFKDHADKVVDLLVQDLPRIVCHGRHEPSLVGLLLAAVQQSTRPVAAYDQMHAASMQLMDRAKGSFASRDSLEASDLLGATTVLARGLLPVSKRRPTARGIMAHVSAYVNTYNVRQHRSQLFELSAVAMAVVCDLESVHLSLDCRHTDGIRCRTTTP